LKREQNLKEYANYVLVGEVILAIGAALFGWGALNHIVLPPLIEDTVDLVQIVATPLIAFNLRTLWNNALTISGYVLIIGFFVMVLGFVLSLFYTKKLAESKGEVIKQNEYD